MVVKLIICFDSYLLFLHLQIFPNLHLSNDKINSINSCIAISIADLRTILSQICTIPMTIRRLLSIVDFVRLYKTNFSY